MTKTDDPRQLELDEWIKNVNTIKVLHTPVVSVPLNFNDALDELLAVDMSSDR